MKTPLKILKFGGSSFPSLESYREIASYLKMRLENDAERLVVVVSAMSGTTGKLQEAGLSICSSLSSEVLDSLLGTGEMVAACLMRGGLETVGVSSSHLTGYQLGIESDAHFTRAGIKNIDPTPIRKLLGDNQVVVISGGQARTHEGRLTMLGRNSSDLSAVAIAKTLQLEECEILSDVPGVYSSDPYKVTNARLLTEVPYDQIITMSRAGAKVLHFGSVEYAKKYGIRILCRSSKPPYELGSRIGQGSSTSTITMNSKVHVMLFNREAGAIEASGYFNGKGFVCHLARYRGHNVVVLSTENRAWLEAVKELEMNFQVIENLSLITVYRSNGESIHFCAPTEDAEGTLNEWHDQLEPSVSIANTIASPLRSLKARSNQSGILLGMAGGS